MLEGRFENFTTILRFFRIFPKIFKRFGNLSECLFLHSPVLFHKFFKEFPNIQQRRHEPLLPGTDRPFNLKLICTRDFFIKFKFNSPVQFGINLHL